MWWTNPIWCHGTRRFLFKVALCDSQPMFWIFAFFVYLFVCVCFSDLIHLVFNTQLPQWWMRQNLRLFVEKFLFTINYFGDRPFVLFWFCFVFVACGNTLDAVTTNFSSSLQWCSVQVLVYESATPLAMTHPLHVSTLFCAHK